MSTKLAIDGGLPAVTAPVPNWPGNWPTVITSIHEAVADGSWGQYHSEPLTAFVQAFADWLQVPYVWPCCSGTVAVELALRGLGVKEGDEVAISGYDFPGNFRAIESIGARPVLVDVREHGYVIDADSLERAVSDQTTAVIVSHLHGQLASIPSLRKVCSSHVMFLEDACQVPGSSVDGILSGSLGDAGVFSFGGSKLLTAGRGGAVVTRHQDVQQRIRIAAERGNDAFPMSTLQAAALTPQLKMLPELNQQRLKTAVTLRQHLTNSRLFVPLADEWNTSCPPAFYKFPIQVTGQIPRQRLIDCLQAEGVPVDIGFRGFTRRSSRRCRKPVALENSIVAAERTMLLHHVALAGSADLVEQICVAFSKVDSGLSALG